MYTIEIHLSLEQRTRKSWFLQSDSSLIENMETQRQKAKRICKYIEEVHEIDLPKEFVDDLLAAHCRFYQRSPFYMDYHHVDAIVAACEVWRSYIDRDQFTKLVLGELISFARIHTSVIQAGKIQSVQQVRLVTAPDFRFATIVGKTGNAVACA